MPFRDEMLLARMEVAGVEEEMAVLDLVVAHDDRADRRRRGASARFQAVIRASCGSIVTFSRSSGLLVGIGDDAWP